MGRSAQAPLEDGAVDQDVPAGGHELAVVNERLRGHLPRHVVPAMNSLGPA